MENQKTNRISNDQVIKRETNAIKEMSMQLVEMQRAALQRQNEDPVQKFLNETCEHAIEITEFCKNIDVNDTEMITMHENGIFAGILQIFLRNFKKYSVLDRPIQCVAYKNNDNVDEVFVKYNKIWIRETRDSKLVINSAITQIIQKSLEAYRAFTETNGIDSIQSITREQRTEFSDKLFDIFTRS